MNNLPVATTDLTPKQDAFARYYVEHGSIADAYRSAYDVQPGTTSQTIRGNGHRILNHPRVAAFVRALRAELTASTLMSTNELISDLEAMANADVNELMTLTVVNCRHCRGVGHAYQWVDATEWAMAAAAAHDSRTPLPSDAGGYGFKSTLEPLDDCPHCAGAGVNVVRLANTADVTPGARKLYRGIELYPDGSVKKILLNDPLAARIELHRVRGLHIDRSVNLNVSASMPAVASDAAALLEAYNLSRVVNP
jgi:hypothetical protein